MTQLISLIQNFKSAESAVHALPQWKQFKAAKAGLKEAFHSVDTDSFLKDDFNAAINAQCGAKTLKKIEEFAKKELSSFSSTATANELPLFFVSAGQKLEEATKAIASQMVYQAFRSVKKEFKKLVKKSDIGALLDQLGTSEARGALAAQKIDMDSIADKMKYWARKQ